MEFHVLAIGDVVAESGLDCIHRHLRTLRRNYNIGFCIINGENTANGLGILPRHAEELFDAGADAITLGNHAFSKRDIVSYLEDSPYILRPANLAPQTPGRGFGIYETNAGPLAVINLIGRCNMDYTPDNPFLQIEKILPEVKDCMTFVDFHAEATSEKLAMGYHLDGRVSAVWGTHTHVPTADLTILPHGTGYVTDLGMTGPAISVIGIKPSLSIARFRGDLPSRYEPAPGPAKLQGVVFTVDSDTKQCIATERILIQE
jgi:metallophosphoesterase (TIGR00282 family)